MSELPSIPKQWTWAKLGEIAHVQLGKMLSPKAATVGAQRPYLRNQNVRWGTIDYSDVQSMGFTSEEALKFEVRPGDVLVCEGGEVGRSAVYRRAAGDFLYQKALHRVRCGQAVLPEFFQLYMAHEMAVRAVTPRASETTIQHLPLEKMQHLPVPLPPVVEQRRIVQAIEVHFTQLDATAAALARARSNLKRYRASVLKAACEGTLGGKARGGPFQKVLLEDVASTSSGGTPSRGNPAFYGGDIPWVKSGELNDGMILFADEKLTRAGIDGSSAKIFPAGTLCMAMYGATVGKLGILGFDAATNQAVCGITVSPKMDRQFLFYYLMGIRPALVKQGIGGAQPNISQKIIRETPVPLPPLQVQEEIVREIESRLSVADALAREVDAGLKRLFRLRQAILKKAFDGKLVPQNPRDEPVAVVGRAEPSSVSRSTRRRRSAKVAK